jgi:hypothetical protein
MCTWNSQIHTTDKYGKSNNRYSQVFCKRPSTTGHEAISPVASHFSFIYKRSAATTRKHTEIDRRQSTKLYLPHARITGRIRLYFLQTFRSTNCVRLLPVINTKSPTSVIRFLLCNNRKQNSHLFFINYLILITYVYHNAQFKKKRSSIPVLSIATE